jgi:predicted lipid-binding transport protein (Tim44 family)
LRYTFIKRELPANNPIANALVIIAGALVIGVSIVLGFFAFVAFSALVLVAAAVIGVRVWWLKRRIARRSGAGQRPPSGEASGGVIEGEYRVVKKDRNET